MSSSLRKRVTSAPYRFPEQSPYHSQCCHNTKDRVKSTGAVEAVPMNYDEFQKKNTVVQDEMWKNSCSKEKNREAKWEQTWGFLTNYDQKGNRRKPKEFIDQETDLFSGEVPKTSNGHYGQRVTSANSSFMQALERTPHNLKKNKEILYYD